MKKNIFFAVIIFIVIFLFVELSLNLAQIRPSNASYGWNNAHKTYNKYINKICKAVIGITHASENIFLLESE